MMPGAFHGGHATFQVWEVSSRYREGLLLDVKGPSQTSEAEAPPGREEVTSRPENSHFTPEGNHLSAWT